MPLSKHRRPLNACITVGALALSSLTQPAFGQDQTAIDDTTPVQTAQVSVTWDDIIHEARVTPTYQVVVMPQMRPGSPLREPILNSMANLPADNTRLVPWFTSPRLSVPALDPPGETKTSWNFELIDPQVVPYLDAMKGREPALNFSVIPRWMFKTTGQVSIPEDLDKIIWSYSTKSGTGAPVTGGVGGAELVDPSGRQVGEYYGRVVSWYTRGGFTDENGTFHASGHFYAIPWWEVLSELDSGIDIRQYNTLYDAIVGSISKVSPDTKFTGLNLWCPSEGCTPANIEFFLDPKNHAPGIPIDAIGYHSYIVPTAEQTAEHWQYTFFQHADQLLDTVRFVEQIKRRLRPEARIDLNEVGCILMGDMIDVGRGIQDLPPMQTDVPAAYWNACGAYYAYLFAGFAQQGTEVVLRKSQLFGYPGQFSSVSMLDSKSGVPNARYRVLELLVRHFGPGDWVSQTISLSPDILAQGFVTDAGRRLMLVNKRNRQIAVTLKDSTDEASMEVVDMASAGGEPRIERIVAGAVLLEPFAVAVVKLD